MKHRETVSIPCGASVAEVMAICDEKGIRYEDTEITGDDYYGISTVELELQREETPEEATAREEAEAQRTAWNGRREYEAYLALREKFDPQPPDNHWG